MQPQNLLADKDVYIPEVYKTLTISEPPKIRNLSKILEEKNNFMGGRIITNKSKVASLDKWSILDMRTSFNKTIGKLQNNEHNFGELSKDITDEIFDKIRSIVNKLYQNNIIYPDITGYNFIEYGNKIWIIDFEHALYKNYNKHDKKKKNYEYFVNQFIYGENNWNPEFK